MALCFFSGGCLFWSGWARRKGRRNPSTLPFPAGPQNSRDVVKGKGGKEGREQKLRLHLLPQQLAEKGQELANSSLMTAQGRRNDPSLKVWGPLIFQEPLFPQAFRFVPLCVLWLAKSGQAAEQCRGGRHVMLPSLCKSGLGP